MKHLTNIIKHYDIKDIKELKLDADDLKRMNDEV
jgi:hypothetical protein